MLRTITAPVEERTANDEWQYSDTPDSSSLAPPNIAPVAAMAS
jgi:hypothetical protein